MLARSRRLPNIEAHRLAGTELLGEPDFLWLQPHSIERKLPRPHVAKPQRDRRCVGVADESACYALATPKSQLLSALSSIPDAINRGPAWWRHHLLGTQKTRQQPATTRDGFFAPLSRVCITVAPHILILCKRFPKPFY